MTAATSSEADIAARAQARRRPGRAGTTVRRWGVIAEIFGVAAGVIFGYALLIDPARRFEVRAVADILNLFGVREISGALGYTLVIFRPHAETISAALTPSCSSLTSVLALGGLAGSVLRRRRAHTFVAFLVASVLLVAANLGRVAASAMAGLWFGKPALLLFHDWVGTMWNFAGTLAGFLLLVALTLPTAERAEQDRSGRHTARRPSGWGRAGLGYRVPALDKSRRPHRRTMTSLAMRYLLPGAVSSRLARRRESRRIDYRIGHLSSEQRIEVVTELARPGLGIHTASLLAVATYETEIPVLDSLANAVVTRQWEPVSSPGVASLRLWARGWLMRHPNQGGTDFEPRGSWPDDDDGAGSIAGPVLTDGTPAAHARPAAGAVPANGGAPVGSMVTGVGVMIGVGTAIEPSVNRDMATNVAPQTGRTVMVTGAGGPAGIAVVRNLVGAGHRVLAVDADPLAAGLRLAAAGTVVPPADSPGYADAMLAAVSSGRPEALICTVVEEYEGLTALVPALDALGCRTWLPDLAAAEVCNDKDAFARRLHEAGVPHPPTASNPRTARRLPGPWIVKPRRGRGSRDVVLVDDPAELVSVMASIPGSIAQSRLSGREFTADTLVDRDGRLLTCVPRWRVETKAGISVKGLTFESVAVTRLVADTLAAVGVTGPANVQGFVDADGEATVIEVNPRFSGGLPLTLAAGADVVGAYLNGILEPDARHPTLSYVSGVQMIRYFSEVYEDAGTGQRLADPVTAGSAAPGQAALRGLEPMMATPRAGRATRKRAALPTDSRVMAERRARVLRHARTGQNPAETCRIFGISRSTLYRWSAQAGRDGLDSSTYVQSGPPLESVS